MIIKPVKPVKAHQNKKQSEQTVIKTKKREQQTVAAKSIKPAENANTSHSVTDYVTYGDLYETLAQYMQVGIANVTFATKEQLVKYATKSSLSAYETISDLDIKLKKYNNAFNMIKNELSVVDTIPDNYSPESIDSIVQWNEKITDVLRTIKYKLSII